jgi:hypothetical protein
MNTAQASDDLASKDQASNSNAFVELLMKHAHAKQSERELGGDANGALPRPATTQVIELGTGNTTRQPTQNEDCGETRVLPGPSLDGLNGTELIDAFRDAQGKRAPVYAEFNRGFKEMLRSGDLSSYPYLSAGATQQFIDLSKQINAIEGLLRAESLIREANLIREVQVAEKRKLHLTVAQQLDHIRIQHHSVEDQEQTIFENSMKKSVVELEAVVDEINGKIRQIAAPAGTMEGDY